MLTQYDLPSPKRIKNMNWISVPEKKYKYQCCLSANDSLSIHTLTLFIYVYVFVFVSDSIQTIEIDEQLYQISLLFHCNWSFVDCFLYNYILTVLLLLSFFFFYFYFNSFLFHRLRYAGFWVENHRKSHKNDFFSVVSSEKCTSFDEN